jgi:integral membrane protein (TIGR01906 family)
MKNKTVIIRVLVVIVTVLIPVVILMVSVRLLITPTFVHLAYRLPGFPDDPYGFTFDDRIRWSQPSINYLVNNEEIAFLSELSFEDGVPIFNARELSHMVDVKEVVTGLRVALAVAVIILLISSVIAIRTNNKPLLIQSYHMGGWATIGLIVAILLFVAFNFDNLFNWFHQIFFESGTWQFYTSDTLIRLFPMRFWRDAFIFVGLLSMIMGVGLTLLTRNKNSGTTHRID